MIYIKCQALFSQYNDKNYFKMWSAAIVNGGFKGLPILVIKDLSLLSFHYTIIYHDICFCFDHLNLDKFQQTAVFFFFFFPDFQNLMYNIGPSIIFIHYTILTLSTLLLNSADDTLMTFFLFFPENRIRHANCLHWKNKKNILKCRLLKFLPRVLNINHWRLAHSR